MQNALLQDGLRFWASEEPNRVAVTLDDDEELTYGELYNWSSGAAAHLAGLGVTPGDNVCIIGTNSIEWIVWAFGILRAGGVIVPLNERFVATELAYLVSTTAPQVIVADAARIETIRSIVASIQVVSLEDVATLREGAPRGWVEARVESSALAQIIFTSGTTGRPKGVMISHTQLLSKYFEARLVLPDFGGPELRPLMMVSLQSHPGTTWGYLFATTNGGTFSFMRRFDPALALKLIVARRISAINSFPLMLEQISRVPGFAEADLSSIRVCITGGTRVPPSVLNVWRNKGVLLRQMYGMTEAHYISIASEREVVENRLTCGRPMIFTRVRIVRPDSTECDVGEAGEIQAKGPGLMIGYWKDPEATSHALRDGWLITGDRGVIDAEGYLTYVDRQKDMIITGGFNVSPSEVENVIGAFNDVIEVAVIPVPDQKFGEVPAACLYGRRIISTEEVFKYCKKRLAGFKLPRYILQFEEPLPRVTNGKIDKKRIIIEVAESLLSTMRFQ